MSDIDLGALAKQMGTKTPAAKPKPAKKAAKKPTAKKGPATEATTPEAPTEATGETWAASNKRGNVYLPAELRERATAHAEGQGLSFSALVRQLLIAELGE
ncbi:MAG: hypothetical protein ACRBI6_16150 [Acidimicrobiales bacterium]